MSKGALKPEISGRHKRSTPGSKTGRMLLVAALAAACVGAFPNPISLADNDPLATLIARARVALGPGLGSVRSTYMAGTANAVGINGTFQSWTDRTNGRYSTIADLGPLSGADGYDGTIGWRRDSKGIVLPQTGPAGRAFTANQIFTLTDALFKPDRGGARVSYLGSRTDSGKTYEVIEVQPPGGYPMEEWYDATTALLAREVVTVGGHARTTDTSAYQSVVGLMMAHEIRITNEAGPTVGIKLTLVRVNISDLEDHLHRSASPVNDFSLTGNPTSIPFKHKEHEILFDVYINGKGPFHFNFDSGGSNLMDPTVAWQVGAHLVGNFRMGGVGSRTAAVQFARVEQLSIGGATLKDQYFLVAAIQRPDLSRLYAFDLPLRPVQGLIGSELLKRFVATIDYAGEKISLRLPTATAGPSAGQTSVPLLFDGALPEFACRIDGLGGTCLADTGFFGSVELTTPFAGAHQSVLIQPRWGSGARFIGAGFGGSSRGRPGSLGSLQMGAITLTNLDAVFSLDERGGFANPFLAGIVGNQVWNRFTVTFDYPHATLGLVRNANFDTR